MNNKVKSTPVERPLRRSGRRLIAPDEAELWRTVTRDVTPLRPSIVAPGSPAPDAPSVSAAPETPNAPKRQNPVHRPVPAQRMLSQSAGLGTGINGQTRERLGRGAIEPEAVLDLHGMTQEHAHTALDRFLARSVALTRRYLLIITGKGSSGRGPAEADAPWMQRRPGTLRTMVPLWLEHSPHRNRIATAQSAHPRHGGAGALYVCLRTKDESRR